MPVPRQAGVPGWELDSYYRVMTMGTTPVDLAGLLSRREREVMDRASHGLTNARIAEELLVSTHAIKFHLASVYRKLEVANRTEATALYVSALSREGSTES